MDLGFRGLGSCRVWGFGVFEKVSQGFSGCLRAFKWL